MGHKTGAFGNNLPYQAPPFTPAAFDVAAGNDNPALAETGNQAEQIAATTQPSPVTFVSALLLLAVLIGLGGFSFSARQARLIDENQK